MDIELKLLAGLPVEIKGVGLFHNPKIREIIDLGESKYNYYLSSIFLSRKQVQNADENLNDFELLFAICYHNKEFQEIFFNALKFFFKEEDVGLDTDNQSIFFYFGEKKENRRITQDNFDEIKKLIRVANFLEESEKEEFNPINEKAKEIIAKFLKNKEKLPKIKEKMNLHSILSGIAWKSKNLNIFNVFDLTLYQLYDGFYRMDVIDYYQSTIQGLNAGTIDGSKIDLKKIHWTKIINN